MSELTRVVEDQRSKVVTALHENGIDVPNNPDPNAITPRRWLLRGEANKTRLLDTSLREFKPQSGQMGSYGVFLGDCLASLMYYSSGIYYLFDKDSIDSAWLCIPSESYTRQIQQIGQQHNLSVDNLHDGLLAESILFQQSTTYQPISGIVTIPYSLDVGKAQMIFVSSGILSFEEIEQLPNALRAKIVILK